MELETLGWKLVTIAALLSGFLAGWVTARLTQSEDEDDDWERDITISDVELN